MNNIVRKDEERNEYEIYNQTAYDALPQYLQNFVRMSIEPGMMQLIISSWLEPDGRGYLANDGSIDFLSQWYDRVNLVDINNKKVYWDDKIKERRIVYIC